jgi:hypothetical protein
MESSGEGERIGAPAGTANKPVSQVHTRAAREEEHSAAHRRDAPGCTVVTLCLAADWLAFCRRESASEEGMRERESCW